jgi:hypothetical protein
VQCGALRYGDPNEADLIKIHAGTGKLTLLHYDNFEKDEPILQTRIKINLRNQYVDVFDHRNHPNVLKNKSLFFRKEA